MASQYGFLVDSNLCIGCVTCAMACKNQYHQESGVVWRELYPLSEEIYPHRDSAYLSLACNHCEKPSCMKDCPVSAYEKRDDGIVIHHQKACIGCGNCIKTCPFGAPRYNPTTKKAEKCSLCYQRIDAGLKPACVQGCPTDALKLIDLGTFSDSEAIQHPPGFPVHKDVNPSTRFKVPKQPKIIRKKLS